MDELRREYERKYGFAVFALKFKEGGDRIVVSGEVLTGNQKHDVELAVAEASGKKVENRIKTLCDVSGRTSGWARVKREIVELKSRFVDSAVMNGKILKRIRCSQASKGEVLRIIYKKDDQLLVQSGDLTLGWVDRRDVVVKKESLRREWQKGIMAAPDSLIAIRVPREDVVRAAETYLGVPYVLGAKSEAAIDCSGLTQLAYREAFGIILPRHSWDQKRMGVTVSLEDAQTGDLVFMNNGETDVRHVGIFERTPDGNNIIHASLSNGGVVRQSAEEVLRRYKLAEVRRIIRTDN